MKILLKKLLSQIAIFSTTAAIGAFSVAYVSADEGLTVCSNSDTGGETTVILYEDFENCTSNGALPDGWSLSKTNSSYTWKPYKYFSHMGAYCAHDTYDPDEYEWWSAGDPLTTMDIIPMGGAKQDERLITPSLNLYEKTGAISFQFTASPNIIKNSYITATLEGSSDNGSTWTELWNAKDYVNDLKTGIISNYVGTGEFTVDIPEELLSDGAKFSFRYQSKAYNQNGGPAFVDNVKVTSVSKSIEADPSSEYTINSINYADSTAAVNITKNTDASGILIIASYSQANALQNVKMVNLTLTTGETKNIEIAFNADNSKYISCYILDTSNTLKPLSIKMSYQL